MSATNAAIHSRNCLTRLKTWAQEPDCDCELGHLRNQVKELEAKLLAQSLDMALTMPESECLQYLATAWNKFLELAELHPTHRVEFMHAIHAAQNIVLVRPHLRKEKTQ